MRKSAKKAAGMRKLTPAEMRKLKQEIEEAEYALGWSRMLFDRDWGPPLRAISGMTLHEMEQGHAVMRKIIKRMKQVLRTGLVPVSPRSYRTGRTRRIGHHDREVK